jgi:hypothetical protein
MGYVNHIEALLFQHSLPHLARGAYAEAPSRRGSVSRQALRSSDAYVRLPPVARGCARCGLGHPGEARDDLYRGLPWAKHAPAANVALRYGLTGIAAVFLHDGQGESAAELLSLVAHHMGTPPWWIRQEPLTQRLVEETQQVLPAADYAAAWERGKSLDVEAVVNELLAEFAPR